MPKGYDFIIVGGGSAGCLLAARLSEDPSVQVCLIEAGGRDRHPYYHMPAGFAKMTKGLGSWGFSTVPQKHLNDRVLVYTQAKVIGGGSTVNAQVYTRGNALDYDEWRQLGCEGWSYEDVLPYFRKSEKNDSFDNRYHGQGGALGVSQPRATLPICEAFFKGAASLGIPRNHDLTGESQDGVGFYQLTQLNGRRSSAAIAFLRPAMDRPNLDVRMQAQVLRLAIENGRATGVVLAEEGGGETTLSAGSEVIVASGAIGSPKLLMLSGLGPADHLRAHGINVLLDQDQIGANLQDHLDLSVIAECTGDHTYDKYANPFWATLAGLQYLATRRGPVASSLFETGGFWYVEEGARSPDLQFHMGLGSGIEAGIAKIKSGVTLNSAYMRPRSRGSVRLASADPATAPLIDPNYWSDPHDREMALRGLRLAQDILASEPMNGFVRREIIPGPEVKTDADYFNYASATAKTDHHPVGTCRMGSDPDAVVTPRLVFNGVEGLRVVDASIMPRLISSNTNAATIMIAEKAADMIKADYAA
ncbi:MAG: GMC family oxidoreductase N-terminal domain-containing protein [Pseudomonadota bacterium]